LTVTTWSTTTLTTQGVTMSNHFSAANLKSPGGDARLDLTDLFVFAAPGDPGRTVLIWNSEHSRRSVQRLVSGRRR
jgi:hypothetical protein